MRTKPNQFRIFSLFVLFARLIFINSSASFAQNNYDTFNAESIALGGISISLRNPWCISNNPALAIPEKKMLTGINWTNLMIGSGMNYTTASYQKRFDKTGIGVQFSRIGYSVSSKNVLHLSMAKKWNNQIQTGLSIQRKWLKVNELKNQLVSINATIGVVIFVQKTQFTAVIKNLIPNSTSGLVEMAFTTGIKHPVSENVNTYIEIGVQPNSTLKLSVGFDYAISEVLCFSIGTQKNPQKLGFGFRYDLNKSFKITTAADLSWKTGATNSASLSWAHD